MRARGNGRVEQYTRSGQPTLLLILEPPFPDKKGLQQLLQSELQIHVSKPKQVQCSNWENQTLSKDQIRYAALDAWAGRAVFLVSGERRHGRLLPLA